MKYTIIITIYNKEKYLKKAIISACTQSYNNYEVIVVNDGSTDNSNKEIEKLKKQYNFKYYIKDNSGVSDTRNYAIDKVKTPYFLFLDADDYLESDLLETVDQYNDYDILSFNAINKDKNNNIIKYIKKTKYIGTGDKYIELLIKNKSLFTVPWGYIYNTKYFKNNNYKYKKGDILEDFELTPFILVDAKKIISIDYYGYNYTDNDNGIVNNKNNSNLIAKTYIKHYKSMLSKINNSSYKKYTKETLKDFIAGAIIWYGSTLNKKDRKEYIKIVKELKVTSNLNKNIIKKIIIKTCYKINIYYQIRNIYYKLYISKKENSIIDDNTYLYGDYNKCIQIAYVLGIKKPIIINKINNIKNKKILLVNKLHKDKNNYYINMNKVYKILNKEYKSITRKQETYKSKIKRLLVIYRPHINNVRIINKIPIKLLKPSEMLIKTINSKKLMINCKKLEDTCYIDKYGDIYGCCPGWVIIPFGNILKDNFYDNYTSRIIKLSSINNTFSFCDISKCKHKCSNKIKANFNNISYLNYPKELTIAYDQSCNLKCLSCRKKHYKAKDKELDRVNNITSKILESNWLNKSDIVLAGQGEVFYSDAYKKLLDTNYKRNKINILSNGTLFTKKNLNKLIEKYNDITISISIDASTKDTYKYLRCGNFDILINNLKNISKERKNNNIKKFQLNYVVQKDNYKEMEKFIKLAKELNVDTVQFTKLGDWGTYTKEEYQDKCLITKDNILDNNLYNEFKKDIFKDKIVDIDSFKEAIELSRKYYGDKNE